MKMNFANKFIICCVVTSFVIYSVKANFPESPREVEACMVQYLQTKGKLSADFQSAKPASSGCDFTTPFTINVIKGTVFTAIEKELFSAALCLSRQLNNKEAFDYIVKINVLAASGWLNATERQTQVEATRSQFKEDLEKIATHCETDVKKFLNIFADTLAIRNDSLAALQYNYCLAKYAVDNKFVELGDVEINPGHIDPNDVDCEKIIEADRSTSNKFFIERNAATFPGEESMNCALNAYRRDNIYDWRVAFKVLTNLDFSAEVKEVETTKITDKMGKFARSTRICSEQNVKE